MGNGLKFRGQIMNSDWLHSAGWGVFTHWCGGAPSPKAFNERVDGFDVELLARQLVETKARYYFITLGQCSGYYCAPNETYDRLVQHEESHCSKRDLISDIADALGPHGIRLLVYLAAEGPTGDPHASRQLKCFKPQTLGWDIEGNRPRPGRRCVEFQLMWQTVIREWSERFGRKVHGWWMDGCYWPEYMYRFADAPNFKSFADALRAGNPDSLIAFNGGLETPIVAQSEHEDYTAGEIGHLLPLGTRRLNGMLKPITRFVDGGIQYHILTHLGEHWGRKPARFPDELVIGYTKYVTKHGGVITWDAGLDERGEFQADHFSQLKALGKAMAAG